MQDLFNYIVFLRSGRMVLLASLAFALSTVTAWDVAHTPPLGWNSWNFWDCRVNGTVLMASAKAMSTTGLAGAGYMYVNSDDCWMLAARDANGNQVANPDKFPDGFAAVATYIHSLGLKSGLYTAKGPNTCAGFAASCEHEAQDAAQWAKWGIDYVKDDSCSGCASYTDNELYHAMWSGIQASGREMVLTVEGNPDNDIITLGGFGNAKRVGHDITPRWLSAVSLVDIGSGLWPFAHNSTNATFGGFWNDLDMIEVGNAPDFSCAQDAPSLARCQAHFALWCIMKAPLILGSDLPSIDPVTLGVLANAEALAVNQDALGVQARRVAVALPANNTLGASEFDVTAVVAPCDASRATQRWTFRNSSGPVRNMLYLVPCNASDPYQQWSFAGSVMKNVGAGMCVDAAGPADPGEVRPCNPGSTSQQWSLQASGHVATAAGRCLDVYNFVGPDVEIGWCKVPGQQDSNQVWTAGSGGTLLTASTSLPPNTCLAATAGPSGGSFVTTDPVYGGDLCLANLFGSEGGWAGVNCSTQSRPSLFTPVTHAPNPVGPANYTLQSPSGGPSWNTQPGASGPWPHMRYISGYSWAGAGAEWTLDLAAAQTPAGTRIMASDHLGILDDDLVGGVTRGGDFCLDLVTGGMLETWAGPLTGGRWALSLFNRSPAADTVTANWASFNVSATAAFAVRDIWAAADRGTFTGSYSAVVPAHAVAFLVLTPA